MALGYGQGSVEVEQRPEESTDFSGAGAQTYTWPVNAPRARAYFQLHVGAGVAARILWNGDSDTPASATRGMSLVAGDPPMFSPPGSHIRCVSIHMSGASTFGTDFEIAGWRE